MPANAPKLLLRSEQSGGALSVIDVTGSATPPLHRHDFDETFYVLEGELTFQLDDELVTRRAGELALRPTRRPPHLRQPERRRRPRPAGLHAGRPKRLVVAPPGAGQP